MSKIENFALSALFNSMEQIFFFPFHVSQGYLDVSIVLFCSSNIFIIQAENGWDSWDLCGIKWILRPRFYVQLLFNLKNIVQRFYFTS